MTIWQRLYAGLLGAFLYPITLAFVLLTFPFAEIVKSFNAIYRNIVEAYQTGRIWAGLMNVLLQVAKIIVVFVFLSIVLPSITSLQLYSIILSGAAAGLLNGVQYVINGSDSFLNIFEERYINDNPVLGVLRPIHHLLSRALDYFRPRLIIPPFNLHLNINLQQIRIDHWNLDFYRVFDRYRPEHQGQDRQPVRDSIHSLNLSDPEFEALQAIQQPRLNSNELERLAQAIDPNIIYRLGNYNELSARLDVDPCLITSERPSKQDTVLLMKQYFDGQRWTPVPGTSYIFSEENLVRWHQMPDKTNHIIFGDNLYIPNHYEGFETRYVSHRYYDTPESQVGISQELSEQADFLRQYLGRQPKVVDPEEARRQQMRAARLHRFMPESQPVVQGATLNDTNAQSCSR